MLLVGWLLWWMCVVVDEVLYPAVVLHRAPVPKGWKVNVLPFSVVVDE